MSKPNYIEIDGTVYVPQTSKPTGNREVVVCDKGFIFVGNVTEREDGGLDLTNVSNLRYWKIGGFGGALKDPKKSGVILDDAIDMSVRAGAWFTRHPVSEGWGE